MKAWDKYDAAKKLLRKAGVRGVILFTPDAYLWAVRVAEARRYVHRTKTQKAINHAAVDALLKDATARLTLDSIWRMVGQRGVTSWVGKLGRAAMPKPPRLTAEELLEKRLEGTAKSVAYRAKLALAQVERAQDDIKRFERSLARAQERLKEAEKRVRRYREKGVLP